MGTEDKPNPVGRPLKFQSVEELQAKIDEYFKSRCDDDGQWVKPISITGLALALDTTRELLCDYELRDEFSDTVKKAKLRVENFYEERLTFSNATGPIFALKNFDWKDKTESDVKTTTTHTVSDEDKEILKQYLKQKGSK